MDYALFALGLAITLIVLFDAFETVVLPRTVQRRFRLTRVIVRLTWAPLVLFTRLPIGSSTRDWFIAIYGPLLLIFLLATWAAGLILGFGVMTHALAQSAPNVLPWGESWYLSGSVFFTLGLGDVTPVNSATKTLAVIEAGVGFGFLALVIGYLPIFYQAFSRREVAISLLDARAGSPPTAAQFLRRNGDSVAGPLLMQWEQWSAELLESHLSYPVVAYFRSQHEKQSWLAALVLILDASALLMVGLRGIERRQAQFSFAMARHTLVDLAQVFYVDPGPPDRHRLDHDGFIALQTYLVANGFAFETPETAEAALAEIRKTYEPLAYRLGRRLLMDLPPWLPDGNSQDDWQSSPWDTLPPI
jgi:hypothetical protein